MSRAIGTYERLGDLEYFVPYPLPPVNPALQLNQETWVLYGQAMHNLGQLKEMERLVPIKERFIKAYVIKEALLSSEIEGINTTIAEIYTQPITGAKPTKDLQLVQNYTKALESALEIMQKKNYPLTSRVLLTAHQTLMSQGAGEQASPGAFRRQSVKVGNLVPAPAPKIPELMSALEKFINEDETIPPLIKIGLAHAQFEIIHPFLDGNGRIGRMLIVLMLLGNNFLKTPIIYPSYFLKKTQAEYYQRLNAVSKEGDFEGWIHYYLQAINESALDCLKRAEEIGEIVTNTFISIESSIKSHVNSNALILGLLENPWLTISILADELKVSYNTAAKLINNLVDLGILQEEKDGERNKIYKFKPYVDLLYKEY
jgi:Fic family protein